MLLKWKRMIGFCLAFIVVLATTCLALADNDAKDKKLNVVIQTDSDEYQAGQDVNISLVIQNISTYTLSGVGYSIQTSDGIQVKDDTSLSGTISSLASGESQTVSRALTAVSTEPNETETLEPGTTTEPVTTEPTTTESTTIVPATTEPVTTVPATTEPVTTVPATTEPVTTKAAATETTTKAETTKETTTTTTETTTSITKVSDTKVSTGDDAKFLFVFIGIIAVAIMILAIKTKSKAATGIFILLCTFLVGLTVLNEAKADDQTSVSIITVQKTIVIDGKEETITATVQYDKESLTTTNIGIHDPSVFYDPVSGTYYSYGSHIVAGKSDDLVSWTYIANSTAAYGASNQLFSKNYLEEFSEVYSWLGTNVVEGIWALDVVYSEEAAIAGNDPYLMYVTVCNGSWKSAICLATSSSPEGPFSYKGMIVCSDYTSSDVDKTNLLDVMGVDSVSGLSAADQSYYFPTTYRDSSSLKALPDCIDPAAYYDGDGNLYLSYGSFTCYGGIRTLKIDAKTGLRSAENYAYEEASTGEVLSDPYFGKKIANKYGEGPFVLTVPSAQSTTGYYYFLFYSQGNLRSTGGYNMRLFRSEYPDRGFVDYAGNSALTIAVSNTNLGVRIMDNFQFSFMPYSSTANGGNSAIVTPEGKIFVHYHSKSSSTAAYGSEGFIIKSNQMFLNEDGWLVTTPFKYNGETMEAVTADQVDGDYEFIYHRLAYYKDPADVTQNYVSSENLRLNADGTVSGNYTGTWTLDGNNITITIGTQVYKGVVLQQDTEATVRSATIVFTAIGKDNRTIWGSKITKSDSECVEGDLDRINVPSTVAANFSLPTSGLFGSSIAWTTNQENAISISGGSATVTRGDLDKLVTLTATVSKNGAVITKDFEVTVTEEEIVISTVVREKTISLPSVTSAGTPITWQSSDESVIKPDGTVTQPASGSVEVVLTATVGDNIRTETFTVTVFAAEVTSYLYTQDYESVASATDVWASGSAASSLTLVADRNGGKCIQFAPGSANSRGAFSTFSITDPIPTMYTVELDVSLTAGNNQETQYAITGADFAYTGSNQNNGITSGYILKLSAINSTTWTINDDSTKTVTLPTDWVHVMASVNSSSGNVTVIITDSNNNILFNSTSKVNGAGVLKGLYVRGGRYNSVTKVDNIEVY